MAVLKIRLLPDPVLRRKAKRVAAIDPSVKKLIADMLETLHAEPGRAGLAARRGARRGDGRRHLGHLVRRGLLVGTELHHRAVALPAAKYCGGNAFHTLPQDIVE